MLVVKLVTNSKSLSIERPCGEGITSVFTNVGFDNTDLSNPIKTYFWNIPGNTEFSIVGNELFADNSRHLIVLDISDKSDIQYVSHVEDVYTEDRQNENFPDNYFGWFECVDFEKGIVIDWEEAFLEDANCRIGR